MNQQALPNNPDSNSLGKDSVTPPVTKAKRRLAIPPKTVLLASIATLVGLVLVVTAYNLGHRRGYQSGQANSKTTMPVINPFMNTPNPFNTTVGKVASVSASEITIHSSTGEIKKFKITDKTIVSQKTTKLTVGDIHKDQRVTVFGSGNEAGATATRIVVQG